MNRLYYIQLLLLSLGAGMCFFLAAFCLIVKSPSIRKKRTLCAIELITSALLVSDVLEYVFEGNTSTLGYWLERICTFLSFGLLYAELYAVTNYYVSLFMGKGKLKKITPGLLLGFILPSVGLSLVIVSAFTGWIYYFDEFNTFNVGPLFPVAMILPIIILVIHAYGSIKYRSFVSKKIWHSLLILAFLPMLASIVQYFTVGVSVLDLSIGAAAILTYLMFLVDQNDYLLNAANTEVMTGLPNTYGYLLELERKIATHQAANYNAYYFDISRMSLVNRRFGIEAGDQVIVSYAEILSNLLEKDEVLGRLGGNFFVALIRKENTERFLGYLTGIDVPIKSSPKKETVRLSAVAGVYEISERDNIAEKILGNTALAVNQAKNVVKLPYVFMTDDMKRAVEETRQFQENVDRIIEKKEFVPYYQPKVDLNIMKLYGAEAIARWIHNGELVPPDSFIPKLEENYSICKLDFYIYERVCMDIVEWLKAGFKVPCISVNFSRKNLGNPTLAEDIYNIAMKYNVPLELIQVEITETVDEFPKSYLVGVVEALQRYGFSVAIDDFGSGSASIATILDVPFNVMKIDKGFVDKVDEENPVFLDCMIRMAKSCGMSVIAEGVESREQCEILKNLGCTKIQGYYFDMPLSRADFETRLRPEYTYENSGI